MSTPAVPLPRDWTKVLKRGLLCALALHRVLFTAAVAKVRNANAARLAALLELRDEELRIKDARIAAIEPKHRPHYPPAERLAILALRAKTGWNTEQTARRFAVTPATIASWMERLDEQGPDALVQTRSPVNRYPDFVSLVVRNLHDVATSFGKRRLANVLGRCGLRLAATTVKRMLRTASRKPRPRRLTAHRATTGRVVTSKHPHHIWNIDLTTFATAGFWVPWWPFSVFLRLLSCWHIGVVVDHFTRALVAFQVFAKRPKASQICALLEKAKKNARRPPVHIISDHGAEFRSMYRAWCRKNKAKPRFGAVAKHGSISVVERFIRSMKQECLRRILLPLSVGRIRNELSAYALWYNTVRPHSALAGATPSERSGSRTRKTRRLEPRPRYPLRNRARRVRNLHLVVTHIRGRPHLPVVHLRAA